MTSHEERLRDQYESGRVRDDEEHRRKSRRSVLTGMAGIGAGAVGWRWVQTQPTDDRIPGVLRSGHRLNERLWRALSDEDRQAREYDVSRARPLRVNGLRGMEDEIDLDTWSLEVVDTFGGRIDQFDLDGVLADHEVVDMVTEHKCIEGWSTIAHWTGIRFADFAEQYREQVESNRYVGLFTPDNGYYVGLERSAALHPQTLLATHLDGEPLTQDHGAPLRLVTPNHYGIKSIKRIGRIQFTNNRPADYWAERGYDWYSRF